MPAMETTTRSAPAEADPDEMAPGCPDLGELLADAAARVVEGVAPEAFVTWFTAAATRLDTAGGVPLGEVPDEAVTAAFARALWNRFPKPDNRFRPRPSPPPARNDPCPCGSGAKYKQCCLRHEPALETMQRLPLLLHVLDRYPDAALDAIDPAPMDADELLHVLETWERDGDGERVVRLALSMFLSHRRLPRHAPDVLESLLDSWPPGFRDEARETLVDELATSPDGDIAGVAVEERVRLAHERDPGAGWALFRRELGRFAGEPGFAVLEVDLLVDEARTEEAVAAARRWQTTLLALDPDLLDFTEELLVRASQVDPELALERARESDPVLDRLVTLLDETPPAPVAGSHAPPAPSPDATSGRALVLAPTPALAAVEADWRRRHDGGAFDDLTEIVEYLDDEPLALSSFAVLAGLVDGLDGWAEASYADSVLVSLLLRAEFLLYRHLSREAGFLTPEQLPDWDAMVWETAPDVARRHPENRGAIELLERLAGWYDDASDEAEEEPRLDTLRRALDGLDPAGRSGE